MIIEQQLSQLQQAGSNRNGSAFADALVLDQQDQRLIMIANELASIPQSRVKQLCRQAFPDSQQLADLTTEYYNCIRGAAGGRFPSQLYDDFGVMFNPFMTLFAQHDAAWLVPVLKKLSFMLVKLAFAADKGSKDATQQKASDCTRFLSRLLAIAANDRSTDAINKKAAVFCLANLSFKVYYKLHNLRLCDTVIKNTQNARTRLDDFPMSEQVTYRFYVGRYYLYQHRVRKASNELEFAFRHCAAAQYKNKRLILYYLTVSRLIIGIFPLPALLAEYNLVSPFRDIQYAVKLGNFRLVSETLEQHMPTLLKMGVYLLLKNRLQVLCYRSLFRRIYLVTRDPASAPGAPPTLELAKLLQGARWATGDDVLDADDIECLCVSLMDQGYIKGYIHRGRNVLVLQKGSQHGFPPISTVTVVNEDD